MTTDPDNLIDRRRLKRRLTFWRFTTVIAVIAAIAAAGNAGLRQWWGDAHVARLDVEGVILENRERDQAVRALADDNDVKALVVYVNSPGGSTFGGESLYRALRAVAENKPVAAVIGTVGASGGYMVALAADRIFARENSVTGSIGVIWQTAEFSGLMKRLGITAEAITAGRVKGEPSPFRPMSPEGRRAAQNVVDATYEWFVGLVAERRGIDGPRARSLSDGRVYTGGQALGNGLIDALGAENEARQWMSNDRGISTALPVRDVVYGEEDGLLSRFTASTIAMLAGKSFLPERVTLDGLMSVWQPSR